MRLFTALSLGVLAACATARTPELAHAVSGDPVTRVTSGLRSVVQLEGAAPVRYELSARMKRYTVPGVSIAVADGHRIVWARGFGERVAGSGQQVSDKTLFPASSISKPVSATATLRLVDQGRLSLDADVNGYLRSWKVPDNEFTAKEKVTLRRLISHSAGTNVHAFKSYTVGEPLPTLPQILDGAKPANTPPVRVEAVPGAAFRYSGGGVTIEQLVLMEVTGKPFPALMKELVLAPFGMTDSVYSEHLPEALRARAATAHDPRGAPIPMLVHPELAADGLWSTPRDLLAWAIGIAAARDGKSTRLLSTALAKDMLTVQKERVGLGPFIEGDGRSFRFSHEGSDDGYHSLVVYFPETGQGAAVMTNGAGGQPLIQELLLAIADAYAWPGFAPETVVAQAMAEAAVSRVVGTYEVPYEGLLLTVTVRRQGARLLVEVPLLGANSEVVFTSPTNLVMLDSGTEFSLVVDAEGRVTGLRFGPLEVPRRAER